MDCETCSDRGETECEGADFICPACGYTAAEGKALEARLKRATDLLREWRDKYAGREVYVVKGTSDRPLSASQTDLGRDTQRFLENR